MTENVSHNTSYSETSPNVHEVDEELMDAQQIGGPQLDPRNDNLYQIYHNSSELNYTNMPPIVSGRIRIRDSPEIPPNVSSSEIEEMNYTMSPPAIVTQLTQRIIHLQSTFKILDLISFKKNQNLKIENAFLKLKLNVYQQRISLSMTQGGASQVERKIDLNQQLRSDQIRHLLHSSQNNPEPLRIIPQFMPTRNPPVTLSNVQTSQTHQHQHALLEGSLLLDSTTNHNNFDKTLQKLLQSIPDGGDHILSQIKPQIDEEMKKITRHYEDLDRMRAQLNHKIEQVEQMELENLETHLILQQRKMAHADLQSGATHDGQHRRNRNLSQPQRRSAETQTEMNYQSLMDRDRSLELRENQLSIDHFRTKQEFDLRERGLLRKDRELELQDRLCQERTAEYLFKQRELNQRMRDAVTWPLNCLESEERLAEKIKEVKLTPEYYKIATMSIEDERQLQEFFIREENRAFISSLDGLNEHLRLKGEGLLKFEYVVLKERTKQLIVKDYLDSELKSLHQDKLDVLSERERYLRLTEQERQLQDDKKLFDSQKAEFNTIVENLKKHLSVATELNQLYGPTKQKTLNNSKHDLNQSVFDSALQKTSHLISNYILSPSKQHIHQSLLLAENGSNQQNLVPLDQLTLTQRIERVMTQFDRLSELQITPMTLEIMDKKEQNLEAIRKVLTREAYFIDEEKKWLQSQRDSIRHSISRQSKSPQKDPSKLHDSSFADQSSSNVVDAQLKELSILQHNLRMERELQSSLNQQLDQEISAAQLEHQRLQEMERQMNEAKLKMLIKFERIKMLEDFYNSYNTEKPICLEIEVTREEMVECINRVIDRERVRKAMTEEDKKEIKLRSVYKMLLFSFRTSVLYWEEGSDPRVLLFQMIKAFVLKHRMESKQALDFVIKLDRDGIRRLGLKLVESLPQQLQIAQDHDWFDSFWSKIKQQAEHITEESSPDQVHLTLQKMNLEREAFWRFKASQVLKLMNLHYKRRARLHLAFAFQHYKCQSLKSKVALIQTSVQPKTYFQGPLLEDGYLTLDHHGPHNNNNTEPDDSNLHFDEVLGTPKLNTQQQHHPLPTINSSSSSEGLMSQNSNPAHSRKQSGQNRRRNSSGKFGSSSTLGKKVVNQNQNANILNMDTRIVASNYTGISEIIRNSRLQTDLRRLALLSTLMHRKFSREDSRLMALGISRWKSLIRHLEMHAVKIQLKRLTSEVETLKFQEQVMRTQFKVQKTELESKISLLVAHVLSHQSNIQSGGSNSGQQSLIQQ